MVCTEIRNLNAELQLVDVEMSTRVPENISSNRRKPVIVTFNLDLCHASLSCMHLCIVELYKCYVLQSLSEFGTVLF